MSPWSLIITAAAAPRAAAVFWLIQCIYVVQPDERGVELRFGKPKEEISMPGLHFHMWPMETVETVKVTVQQLNIGATS
ncbi:SPFH domain-containing protein, partial [Rhizobium leguminosarum]|uniref:SPFH domain-containing protein n=1 Tax=Rhizobium leguminosarum TaxID=384 RepID=UPI003F9E8889